MFDNRPTIEQRPGRKPAPTYQQSNINMQPEEDAKRMLQQQQQQQQRERNPLTDYNQAPPQYQQKNKMETLEGEDGIRQFYEKMDQPQQQYQQPQQGYQNKMEVEENDRVEQELRQLELEQQKLEQEILQRQQQNQYLDQALEQEKQAKLQGNQAQFQQQQQPPQNYNQQQQYNQQQLQQKQQQAYLPPKAQKSSAQGHNDIFGGQNEPQFTQQQRTSKQLLSGGAPKAAMDQQYDAYMAKKQNQQFNRIESGLIGSHQQSDQQNNFVNANKQKNMTSNVFGGGEYNYFQDKNNQQIDQHVYGRIKKTPENFDPMKNYQYQQEKEIINNQENFLNSIKPNQSSASKYKKTALW